MRMISRCTLAAAAFGAAILTSGPSFALTESEEAAACQGDALRLCAPYVPDKQKIRNCLVTYKSYLSPACRAIVAPAKKKK